MVESGHQSGPVAYQWAAVRIQRSLMMLPPQLEKDEDRRLLIQSVSAGFSRIEHQKALLNRVYLQMAFDYRLF